MAASASGIRAGRAYVELFADDSKLVQGLKAAEGKLKNWGASVASIGSKIFAVGAGITAAFAPAVATFASVGGALDDLAQRTGASVEALSALGYAAGMSGTDMDTLEGGLRKMQQTIADAAGGSESAAAALAALGTSAEELQGMTPDEQFRKLADGIAKLSSVASSVDMPGIDAPVIGDVAAPNMPGIDAPVAPDTGDATGGMQAMGNAAQRTAAAMDVFGKSGADLIPMMSGGSAAIREMEARAKSLGLVMSGEDASAAAALGDVWDELMSVGKALMTTIGAALAPALTEIATVLVQVVAGVVKFVDQNREMIVTVAAVAAGIAGVGAAIVAIGGTIAAIGAVVGAFSAAIAAIPTIISAVGAAFGAILSPIGLAIIAVAAVTGAVLYFSGIGGQILTTLQGVWDKVKEIFGGVIAEIKNGDFQGAWDIVMGAATIAIQKAMLNIKEALYNTLDEIKSAIMKTADSLGGPVGKIMKAIGKGAGGVIDFGFGGNEEQTRKSFATERNAIEAAEAALRRTIDAAKREAAEQTKPPTAATPVGLAAVLGATKGGAAGDEEGKKQQDEDPKKNGAQGTFSAAYAGMLGWKGDRELQKNTAKTNEKLDSLISVIRGKKGLAFNGD